jgi:hypothetical protein
MIRTVTLFSNGNLMVFDEQDQQIGEYNGHWKDKIKQVMEDAPPDTTWEFSDWDNGIIRTNRRALESFFRGFI